MSNQLGATATVTSQQAVPVDTASQPVTTAVTTNVVFPSVSTMSHVLQDLGGEGGEEQQVASAGHSASQPAASSVPSGRDKMWEYVCQMATLHPGINHPPREWIDQNLSDASPVVQDNSSPEEGVLTLADVKALFEAQNASLNERFTQSETAISSFRQRNTLSELSTREDRLDKREKDKRHRLQAYSNLTLKSHTGDLFEIEQLCSDVLGSAGSVCPDLTAHLRHAVTR